MTSLAPIGAILLAAGRSRRMGEFKPLLPFRNSTIIETCLDTIEAAGIEQTVVVLGHRAEELRERLAHRRITFAVNPDPDGPMSASIAAGVAALDPTIVATFIALVDQPAIPPSIYEFLVAYRRDSWAEIVVPEFDGHRGHPVLIDSWAFGELLNLDETSGLRGFLDRYAEEVHRVPVDCPYVRMDVDTPAEYRNLTENVRRDAEKV